jgi:hypothetical protein
MRAQAAKIVSLLAVVALMLGLIPAFTPDYIASAQADELTQKEFRSLVKEAEAEDPIYGPEDGELVADPDKVSLENADVEVDNALIEATFVNPHAADDDPFDIGIQFRVVRSANTTEMLRFIVLSTGAFGVSETGADDLLITGTYDDLDLDDGGENDLTVYADGDVVHLGINGDYVGSVEVSLEDAGDVAVGATFLGDSYVEDSVTEFTNFTVWELGGSSTKKKTPTPEDDEPTKAPKKTKTPKAEPDTEVTIYQSEEWDFSFAYDESIWTVNGGVADSGTEYVSFQSDGTPLMNFVIGDTLGEIEDCLTGMINLATGQLENADITGDVETRDDPAEIEDGPLAGGAELTVDFTVTDGNFPDSVIYSGCAQPDGQDYMVGILQVVPADNYRAEAKLREAVVETINNTGLNANNDDQDEEPTKSPRKTATPKSDDNGTDNGSDLEIFESREYDFAFAYDPELHTVETTTLDNGAEFITVSSEGSLVFDIVVADIFDDDEACLAGILNVGVGILEGVGIEGDTSSDGTFVIEDGTHEGATAAEIDLEPTDSSMPPVSIYIECGPVGNSDYRVGVLQIMDPSNAKAEGKVRQAIVDTFNNVDGGSSQNDDQGNDDNGKSNDDNTKGSSGGKGGKKISDNVVSTSDGGALYTSPSYGFQVGILPGYTVEEDSVQNGYDTLVVANDSSRVTYSMFLSNSTPTQCINSIINNLSNDGSLRNFQIGTDEDGNELRGEDDGYSYVVVLFTAGGQDLARYYACVGGQGAILVFAYEAPLDKFVDQADEIELMIRQIVIPD